MPTFDLAEDKRGCWRFHCVFETEEIFVEYEPRDPDGQPLRQTVGEFLATPAQGEAHQRAYTRVYNFMTKVMDRM